MPSSLVPDDLMLLEMDDLILQSTGRSTRPPRHQEQPKGMWTGIVRLVNLFLCVAASNAEIDAVVILPHGDFALDPTLLPVGTPGRIAADTISNAARMTGKWLSKTVDPDLIFISTPHGYALSSDFGVYLGKEADGTAEIGTDLHDPERPTYTVHLPSILLSSHISGAMVSILDQLNVSGILSPEPSMKLFWGEVIPMLLIEPRRSNSEAGPRSHIVFSHPLRRYSEAPSMVEELLSLGQKIFDFLEKLPLKVAVLISADLSHTHRQDGPYGFSNSSSYFDSVIGDWASDPCHNLESLITASRFQTEARSCGFTGFVLVQGMMCGHTSAKWTASVLANNNATYYGMMVAQYKRIYISTVV